MNQDIALSTSNINAAIDTIWFAQQTHINVQSLSVPYLQHELILNQGNIFQVNDQPSQPIIFSPITTQSISTRAQGKYQALGIMFNPVGIYTTYGLSAKEFIGSGSGQLFGKSDELYQKLKEAHQPKIQLDIVADFFQQNTVKKVCPSVVHDFLRAVHSFAYQPIEIQKIAADLKFSTKHLIATFKDVTGITPHKYLQLLQLNLALQNMQQQSTQKLTEIALEHGFYDQSHFIRVFKTYAGITPFEFRAKQTTQTHNFANTIIQ